MALAMRSVKLLSNNRGMQMEEGLTQRMLLKVQFCSSKVHQDDSVQLYESLFQPLNSMSGAVAMDQVYLLKGSIT